MSDPRIGSFPRQQVPANTDPAPVNAGHPAADAQQVAAAPPAPSRRPLERIILPSVTIQDFVPAGLHGGLADSLERMKVVAGIDGKLSIKGSLSDCEKVWLTLLLDGHLEHACNVFSACEPPRRQYLAKSGCFVQFARKLASASTHEKSREAFAEALCEITAYQVTTRHDAVLLEKLLSCCPPWAMPHVLEGLAGADPGSALLLKMLCDNPSLARALEAMLASHGESVAGKKLNSLLAQVPLPPQPIIVPPDPRLERTLAYLAAVDMEGDSPELMKMQTSLMLEFQTELVLQGWGAWDVGEFKLAPGGAQPMNEAIAEAGFLLVAVMAAWEATLQPALELNADLRRHLPPGEPGLCSSRAAACAGGVIGAQAQIEMTVEGIVDACVKHLEATRGSTSLQSKLANMAAVLKGERLREQGAEPEWPFREELTPAMVQAVERRLGIVGPQLGLLPSEQEYLRSRLAGPLAYHAITSCTSRDALRKELAWIARYSGGRELFNAVFQASKIAPAEYERAVYWAIELLAEQYLQYPRHVSRICKQLVYARVMKPSKDHERVEIVMGVGGKLKIGFGESGAPLKLLTTCLAAGMFNAGVWPIPLELMDRHGLKCEELFLEFIEKAIDWRPPIARQAMKDLEEFDFAIGPVNRLFKDSPRLRHTLSVRGLYPVYKPRSVAHFRFWCALFLAGLRNGPGDVIVKGTGAFIRHLDTPNLNPADGDARLAQDLLLLAWLSSKDSLDKLALNHLDSVLNQISPGDIGDIDALGAFSPVVDRFAGFLDQGALTAHAVCIHLLNYCNLELAVFFISRLLHVAWKLSAPDAWQSRMPDLIKNLCHTPSLGRPLQLGFLIYELMAMRNRFGIAVDIWGNPAAMTLPQAEVLRATLDAARPIEDQSIIGELHALIAGLPWDIAAQTGMPRT